MWQNELSKLGLKQSKAYNILNQNGIHQVQDKFQTNVQSLHAFEQMYQL